MKIERIKLENFRGYLNCSVDLHGRSSVFYGINGAGKSSILDSISIALSKLITKISLSREKRRYINESDISFGTSRCKVDISVMWDDQKVSWGTGKGRRSPSVIYRQPELNTLADNVRGNLEINELSSVPLVVHYPVNRAVLDIPLRIRKKHRFDQVSSYEKCLTSGTDFRTFFEWFRNQEEFENELIRYEGDKARDPQLEAVRNAIYSFLPGLSNLHIRRKPRLRMVVMKGVKSFEIEQLSDGEKCLMALVGDLSRRLAIANPGMKNPLEGNGVVLIDELELHLHPGWQRTIISRLETTFPNIQFLITSHSPQIIGEVKNMDIFVLDTDDTKGGYAEKVEGAFGKDSNLILEKYMHVSHRDISIKEQLSALLQAISYHNEAAATIYNELSTEIGKDDPEMVKAEVLMRRRGIST